MRVITLLSDFGLRDWFVPSMKGVILGITPHARIVDVTHEIPAQDVQAGAFVLAAAARAFPKGTIHVAVVDPGVGSSRRAIAVHTGAAIFLGPDNGLLSLAVPDGRGIEMRSLENERYFRQPVSRTFHGRDVFAPVAAHLAKGVKFDSLGPKVASIQRLAARVSIASPGEVRGEIIYVDRFGNLISNITAGQVRAVPGAQVTVGKRRVSPVRRSYSDVLPGRAVAVLNSLDLLEIGVRDGDAARAWRARCGTPLRVVRG